MEQAMSPQCFGGQHDICKGSLSWMPDDGVTRTIVCLCHCHEIPATATSAQDQEPAQAYCYRISYEREHREVQNGEPDLVAWVKREYVTVSRESARYWLDDIVTQLEAGKVRNVQAIRAKLGVWEGMKPDAEKA